MDRNEAEMIRQLDSGMQPGLTDVEFRSLFVKCNVCGLISTRRAVNEHGCRHEVIDLTGDSD
jgi:hypothetical protein